MKNSNRPAVMMHDGAEGESSCGSGQGKPDPPPPGRGQGHLEKENALRVYVRVVVM